MNTTSPHAFVRCIAVTIGTAAVIGGIAIGSAAAANASTTPAPAAPHSQATDAGGLMQATNGGGLIQSTNAGGLMQARGPVGPAGGELMHATNGGNGHPRGDQGQGLAPESGDHNATSQGAHATGDDT
jgi:hypothetical protein